MYRRLNFKILFFVLISYFFSPLLKAAEPVTPNALPETKALLKFLYTISGKYTLTGQHNYPNTRAHNSQFAADYVGQTPAVWSTDWGHAKDGNTDSYLARPDIVDEAIRQHKRGALVTICWHAVPPTADEPVTFRQLPGTPKDTLKSVQGQLLDDQFKEVLTPGTRLYQRWCTQVDSVANYLKMLDKARVPVLWRPYHEMNGDWFWWGGRIGKYSTKALYIQLFNRLVKHHQLKNLVWVWSVDRFHNEKMAFKNYFPGRKYVDVLSLDVYGSDFDQKYYDGLLELANGKPLALAEVGNPPKLEILDQQPEWTFWVIWAGMVRNTSKKEYRILVNDPRILSIEDPEYWEVMAPYRAACNLPRLSVEEMSDHANVNFSGRWIFDEERSTLDNWGVGFIPSKLHITQNGKNLTIEKNLVVEYAEDRVEEEKYTIDGQEAKSQFWNSPRITTVNWSNSGDTLLIKSTVTFNRGGQTSEMVTTEAWTLHDENNILEINQTSKSPRGDRNITMIYRKW